MRICQSEIRSTPGHHIIMQPDTLCKQQQTHLAPFLFASDPKFQNRKNVLEFTLKRTENVLGSHEIGRVIRSKQFYLPGHAPKGHLSRENIWMSSCKVSLVFKAIPTLHLNNTEQTTLFWIMVSEQTETTINEKRQILSGQTRKQRSSKKLSLFTISEVSLTIDKIFALVNGSIMQRCYKMAQLAWG